MEGRESAERAQVDRASVVQGCYCCGTTWKVVDRGRSFRKAQGKRDWCSCALECGFLVRFSGRGGDSFINCGDYELLIAFLRPRGAESQERGINGQ